MQEDLQVTVRGLVPTAAGCGVFLGAGEKTIAIFVDHAVGTAIGMALEGIQAQRPLTHDLIGSILAGFGAVLRRVTVVDLKDETFYAVLLLEQQGDDGRSLVEIDARPSDALALALLHKADIFVRPAVWEQAEDMTWVLQAARRKDDEERRPPGQDPDGKA